ncbi:MAG: hypothetical protein JXO48_02895 [Deltaproteobacteria bacterium]|nr:hypothetical protein [Deltaproteobacteria bacterium]
MSMESMYRRQELYRLVKTVFVRHMADLSIIFYTCTQNSATIRGVLRKLIGSDFTAQEVKAILADLSRLPRLKKMRFDLENWEISDQGISWHIKLTCPVKQNVDDQEKIIVLEYPFNGN